MGLLKRNTVLPEEINFNEMQYPKTNNYFLLAPLDIFPILSNPSSPIFDCQVEELEAAWHRMIKQQPRVKLRSSSKKLHRYHYVCQTWLWRFTDYLIVQFFPQGESRSTLLLYSYSVLGSTDFGCNQRRILTVLSSLKNSSNLFRGGVVARSSVYHCR